MFFIVDTRCYVFTVQKQCKLNAENLFFAEVQPIIARQFSNCRAKVLQIFELRAVLQKKICCYEKNGLTL